MCGGNPKDERAFRSVDYHVKRNNIQSESELTEDGSITNKLEICHYFKALNLLFE